MGIDMVIGNVIAFVLKRYSAYATKAIPIALFTWNTFYVMLKSYDPTLVPDLNLEGAMQSTTSFVTAGALEWDGNVQNVSFLGLGAMGNLFFTGIKYTAFQMATHAFSKNTIAQWLLPVLAAKVGIKPKR